VKTSYRGPEVRNWTADRWVVGSNIGLYAYHHSSLLCRQRGGPVPLCTKMTILICLIVSSLRPLLLYKWALHKLITIQFCSMLAKWRLSNRLTVALKVKFNLKLIVCTVLTIM
jgi:hypothetical protein